MSTASSGAQRERRIAAYMEDRGWLKIMRAASSKGAADLAMLHPFLGLAWVQVGTAKSKTLGPSERDRLCSIAEQTHALALLATSGPGAPTRFFEVTRDVPSAWKEVQL